MTRHFLMYFAFALCTSLTQCSKTTVDPNGLPPETQTGAGTFACKINGVVWRYKDPNYEFLDTRPRTRWIFEQNTSGGHLYVGGIRYLDGAIADDEFYIDVDSLLFFKKRMVNNVGKYHFGLGLINYKPKPNQCYEYISTRVIDSTQNFYSSGKLTLTNLDQQARIISGTFYSTIYQTSCDTLKITDGRFDLKY